MKTIFLLLALLVTLGSAAAQERIPPPMLIVNGTADERVTPDNATVRLGVVARGNTAAAAQDAANAIMQRMLQRTDALKIARKDVQTSNLMLNPVYAGNNQGEQLRIVAYEARNVVSINLTDLTLIGKAIDAAVGAGANNVEGVFFGLRNDKEAKLSALRGAVVNAREKAAAMAAALGVEITGVYEVTEGGAMVMPVPMYEMRGVAMDKSSTPVEAGQVTVNASVTIRYLIRAKS
jgi:uncharacterized protein